MITNVYRRQQFPFGSFVLYDPEYKKKTFFTRKVYVGYIGKKEEEEVHVGIIKDFP